MADQNARQDQNQFPALIGHSGTAGTAETKRIVVTSGGAVTVDVVSGEIIASLGTINVVESGTIGEKPLSTRVDEANATTTYVGNATPGGAETASVWQIKRVVDDGAGTVDIKWMDGNANYDNSWDARATASYS